MLQQFRVVVEGRMKTPGAHEPGRGVVREVDEEGRESSGGRGGEELACGGNSVCDGEGGAGFESGREDEGGGGHAEGMEDVLLAEREGRGKSRSDASTTKNEFRERIAHR